ncbi:MAG: hypothetical protein U0Z53_23290 [Blastocatellia bacterium]
MKMLLLASVTCFLLLKPSAAQQQGYGHLIGMNGPAKLVRYESAEVIRHQDGYDIGPRYLYSQSEVSDDGTKATFTSYRPDGTVLSRQVNTYENGKSKESIFYDSSGRIKRHHKIFYHNEGMRIEGVQYDESGSVVSREVENYGKGMQRIDSIITDGQGQTKEKSFSQKGQNGCYSETRIKYLNGKEASRQVTSCRADRTLGNERRYYNADGTLKERCVVTYEGGGISEMAWYDTAGTLLKKDSFMREYDSHGNLIKEIFWEWTPQTGKPEPVRVTYIGITYDDQ